MTWYSLPCGQCNSDGSFRAVRRDCPRCSGTGRDWDEGEAGRERLRTIYGQEPRPGQPPARNLAGDSVHSGQGSRADTSPSAGKAPGKKSGMGVVWVVAILAAFGMKACSEKSKASHRPAKASAQSTAPADPCKGQGQCLQNIMGEPARR